MHAETWLGEIVITVRAVKWKKRKQRIMKQSQILRQITMDYSVLGRLLLQEQYVLLLLSETREEK